MKRIVDGIAWAFVGIWVAFCIALSGVVALKVLGRILEALGVLARPL